MLGKNTHRIGWIFILNAFSATKMSNMKIQQEKTEEGHKACRNYSVCELTFVKNHWLLSFPDKCQTPRAQTVGVREVTSVMESVSGMPHFLTIHARSPCGGRQGDILCM